MPNTTVVNDGEAEIESSSPSNVVGTRAFRRLRKPSGCMARKCCACEGDGPSSSEQKTPQKSIPEKDDSNVRKRRSSTINLTSASRGKASSQVQDVSRIESEKTATVSPHASPPARRRGAGAAQKKQMVAAEQEVATGIRNEEAAPPNKIGVKTAAAPKQVSEKKPPVRSSGRHKVSTTEPESQVSPGSSKKSSRKIHSSSEPSPSNVKKSTAPKKTPRKERKSESGQVKQQVSKEKAEPEASNINLKPSTDTHSSTSDSDSDEESDTYCELRIRWDGVDDYKIGQVCSFCENDLGVASWIDPETEFSKLPVVSVLPCGHAFHHHCLAVADCTEQEHGHPLCVLCASFGM